MGINNQFCGDVCHLAADLIETLVRWSRIMRPICQIGRIMLVELANNTLTKSHMSLLENCNRTFQGFF